MISIAFSRCGHVRANSSMWSILRLHTRFEGNLLDCVDVDNISLVIYIKLAS
eukprot:m.36958 g.36958  ORF g.36958 m.36958 type:complete len:52 (-) comp17529_c0_seq1:343-498(-)